MYLVRRRGALLMRMGFDHAKHNTNFPFLNHTERSTMKRTTLDRRILGGTSILGGVLITSISVAQFSFDPAVGYAVGTQPSGVATGDFDGDMDIDIATTTDDPDKVSILLNDGSGGFVPGPAVFLPGSSSPQDIVAGDLDGDLDIDLAVAVRDPQGSVIVLVNNGAGTFTISGTWVVGDRPRGMDIADMDGDMDLDIALANRDSNQASVLTNNGSGSFSVSTFASGAEPRAAAFIHFTGDGALDLAVTNHDDRTVSLFVNSGGSFVSAGTLFVNPLVRPEGITAADLDGDADTDLAVATSDQTLGINEAAVFINTGGTFGAPIGYATGGTNTGQIIAMDLDCDEMIDLVTTNKDSNNVSFLQNIGGGTFGPPSITVAGTSPEELDAADLDGDGDFDIATADRDSNSISVIMNQTCEEGVFGDVTGDGIVDVLDLLELLADWGACGGCPTDLTGDGVVDVLDLLAMLGAWT